MTRVYHPRCLFRSTAHAGPSSKIDGTQLDLATYSSRPIKDLDAIIKSNGEIRLNVVQLMSNSAELVVGAPIKQKFIAAGMDLESEFIILSRLVPLGNQLPDLCLMLRCQLLGRRSIRLNRPGTSQHGLSICAFAILRID